MMEQDNINCKSPLSFEDWQGDWTIRDPESEGARKNEVTFRSAVLSFFLKERNLDLSLLRVEYGPFVSHYVLKSSSAQEVERLRAQAADLALRLGDHPFFLLTQGEEYPQDVALEIEDGYPYHLLYGDVLLSEPAPLFAIPLGKTIAETNQSLDLEEKPLLYVHGAEGSGKSSFLNQALLSLLSRHCPAGISFAFFDGRDPLFDFVSSLPNLIMPPARTPAEKKKAMAALLDPQQFQIRFRVVFFNGLSGIDPQDFRALMAQAQQGGLSLILSDDDLREPLAQAFLQKANSALFFSSYKDDSLLEEWVGSPRVHYLFNPGDALYVIKAKTMASVRLAEPFLSPASVKSALEAYAQENEEGIHPQTSYALEDSFASLSNTISTLVEYLQKKGGHYLHYARLPTKEYRFRLDVSLPKDPDLVAPSPLELFCQEDGALRGPLYYLASEMALAENSSLANGDTLFCYERGRLTRREKIAGDPSLSFVLSLTYLEEGFRDELTEEDLEEILGYFRQHYSPNILFIKDKV